MTVEGGGSGSVSLLEDSIQPGLPTTSSIVIFQTETGALAKDATDAPEADEKDDGKDAIDGKRRGKTIK